jgi:SPP1 gp7 family putative phage head morphogenesis protein
MPSKASEWWHARRAESQYGVQLRKIARHIGEIIRGFDLNDQADANVLRDALRRYAEMLIPWARSAARAMVAEVAARSDKQWRTIGKDMGRSFADVLNGPDIGARYRELQEEQVILITSIPRDAAEHVHALVQQGLIEGKRFTELVPEIRRGGDVSISKANLIARTETGRVVSNLTQARSESVGSEGYQWATMKDAAVRPSHRAMEGKFVRWDSPPTIDGLKGHAGSVPNCRCFAIPLLKYEGTYTSPASSRRQSPSIQLAL